MRKSSSYGTGYLFRSSYTYRGKVKKSKFWHIAYPHQGRERREATGTADYAKALGILKQRLAGDVPAPVDEQFSIDALVKLVEDDYVLEGRKSLKSLQQSRLPALKRLLAGIDLAKLTEPEVLRYIDARKAEKYSNATINRELACLTRGMRLAQRRGLVTTVPYIKKLRESSPRQGFFERADFDAVMLHVPQRWRCLYEVAYVTGWRLNSELCPLEWHRVDFQHKLLRLEPGTTKNRDGRQFPITPSLETALRAQREAVQALELELERIVRWVFPTRRGEPLDGAYWHFKQAATKAHMQNRIPHDLRRTAVRNLEFAGIDRQTAMKMVGHKTESMYRRYNIVDKKRMEQAGERLALYEKNVAEASKKSVSAAL